MIWTSTETEKLIELAQRGISDVRMGIELDRDPEHIRRRIFILRRAGVNVPYRGSLPWTKAESETVIRLYAEGLEYAEIAEHLPERTARGVESQIDRLIRARRLKRRPRVSQEREQTRLEILTRWQRLETSGKIAKALGITRNAVIGVVFLARRRGDLGPDGKPIRGEVAGRRARSARINSRRRRFGHGRSAE